MPLQRLHGSGCKELTDSDDHLRYSPRHIDRKNMDLYRASGFWKESNMYNFKKRRSDSPCISPCRTPSCNSAKCQYHKRYRIQMAKLGRSHHRKKRRNRNWWTAHRINCQCGKVPCSYANKLCSIEKNHLVSTTSFL